MNPEQRTSDYVCFDCGREYITPKQREEGHVVTCHYGICGLCGENKSITHIRAFNYLHVEQKIFSQQTLFNP